MENLAIIFGFIWVLSFATFLALASRDTNSISYFFFTILGIMVGVVLAAIYGLIYFAIYLNSQYHYF